MVDYHWPLRQAIWGMPVTALFALVPARRARLGDDSMPSPADLAATAARAKAKAFLAENYTILPPAPKG